MWTYLTSTMGSGPPAAHTRLTGYDYAQARLCAPILPSRSSRELNIVLEWIYSIVAT